MPPLKKHRTLLVAIAVLLSLVMVACSRVVSVTINEGDQTLVVGETKQLTVTVVVEGNASTKAEWASDAPDVASVTDGGLVSAHAPGSADIEAKSIADETKSDTITVTVLEIVGDPGPSIRIEKATNGVDADAPPGPIVQVGDPVTWTYEVENTGNVTLTEVIVTDDQIGPIACPKDELGPAERMTCSASGVAVVGQYANLGTVTAATPANGTVTDADPSHYFGDEGGGTLFAITGQVDDPLGFGAFAVGLYSDEEATEDRRLASGTISATGEIWIPLPALTAAQVDGSWHRWCGRPYAGVVAHYIISDAALDFHAYTARAGYLRITPHAIDGKLGRVEYVYSLDALHEVCTVDPMSGADVDVRIEPGWNVVTHFYDLDVGQWFGRSGEPDFDVPWLGPEPLVD